MKNQSIDLVIEGGKLVTHHELLDVDLAIDNGRVVGLGKASHFPTPAKVIHAEGKFVLPGAIDCHVHFRDPGFPQREDFQSGTSAAAAGGITTVIDMPNTAPSVWNAQVFREKRDSVKGRAVVDYALYACAGTDSVHEIASLAKEGAVAFKTLMTNVPPRGREQEFYGIHLKSDSDILDVMEAVAKTGLTHTFHAETDCIVQREVGRLQKKGRMDALAHTESRPNYVEADAIAHTIIVGHEFGDYVHVAHMSTHEGVELVRQAKSRGFHVTSETCAHYLFLTRHDMKRLGTLAKIQPPLRERRDQDSLWGGINDGTIDIICSDHSPFTKAEKRRNIWRALPGAPDMENMIPLMLHAINLGKLSIPKLVEISSRNVAKIFGLYPKKGALKVGSDADVIIVDMKAKRKIRADQMHTKAKNNTIFEGWKVKGLPVMTIVRGEVVMEQGRIVGNRGHGDWQPRISNRRAG